LHRRARLGGVPELRDRRVTGLAVRGTGRAAGRPHRVRGAVRLRAARAARRFRRDVVRLGDALLHTRALSRFQAQVPAPVVALGGATILFVVWQIPALGAIALAGVVAYALGAVVTARLIKEGVTT